MTELQNSSRTYRIESIDVIRGVIMVVMALDHVRDYFHSTAQTFDPTDLTKTSPALFMTRWVTHFCAPTFMFLAGLSVYLSKQRKTKNELSYFLVTRGLWLVFLELTVLRFGFLFNFYYDMTFLTVLWAIGWGMIFMALLSRLNDTMVLILGAFIVVFHTALQLPLSPDNSFKTLWMLLMTPGFLPLNEGHAAAIGYSIIPWLGVILLGYSAGRLFTATTDPAYRKKILITLGICALVAFVILRIINLYDDPWTVQSTAVMTVLSFIKIMKYPPSLHFVLLTMGGLMFMLAYAEKIRHALAQPFATIGRVPLFYFLLHFYVLHAAALVLYILQTGKSITQVDFHIAASMGGISPGAGVSLPWVYVAWIVIVAAVYPLCRRYDRYKQTHRYWWLSYL